MRKLLSLRVQARWRGPERIQWKIQTGLVLLVLAKMAGRSFRQMQSIRCKIRPKTVPSHDGTVFSFVTINAYNPEFDGQ